MVKLTDEEKRLRRNSYMREWKKKNPKLVNAQTKRWKDKHREQVRQVGRKYMQEVRSTEEGREHTNAIVRRYKENHPDRVKASYDSWYKEKGNAYHRDWFAKDRVKNPRRYMIRNCRNRAKNLGVEFSLDEADLIIPEFCPVLGIRMKQATNRGGSWLHNDTPSIDRFDNSKGYTKENIRIISWRANTLKRDGTLDEFRKIVAYMENG